MKKGLKVPEDVTLVWPDDNFGYIKRLSNKEERARKEGQAFTIIFLIAVLLTIICGLIQLLIL